MLLGGNQAGRRLGNGLPCMVVSTTAGHRTWMTRTLADHLPGNLLRFLGDSLRDLVWG